MSVSLGQTEQKSNVLCPQTIIQLESGDPSDERLTGVVVAPEALAASSRTGSMRD